MTDVQDAQDLGRPALNDADKTADALLKRWEDADQLSDQATKEASQPEDNETEPSVDEDGAETVELEADDYEEDPDEEAEQPETDDQEVEEVEITDDLQIEIMVNGEAKQASLGELKRLWGQGILH